MARATWLSHSRNFRTFLRRYGRNDDLGDLYSGIQPVAVVDRDFRSDECDTWGCTGGSACTVGQIPCVALGAWDRDVYIREMSWWARHEVGGFHRYLWEAEPWWAVNVYTIPSAYNPLSFNLNALYPLMIAAKGELLPAALVFTGYHTLAPIFSPFQPESYPLQCQTNTWYNAGTGALTANTWGQRTEILRPSDPPVRLAPFTALAVQFVTGASGPMTLFASFRWSERETEVL